MWQNPDGSPKEPNFSWSDGTNYESASCTSSACAGGAGGTSLSVTPQLTPPATPPAPLSPTATEISVSGGNSGDPSALEWVKQKGSTATHAAVSQQSDWWAYLEASASTPHTLEFDTFWGNGSHLAMWGSHCNYSSQVWEADAQDGTGWKTLIDAQTGSGIPCNLSKNAWHHITWQVHQDAAAGKIYYDYLTIDGTTYIVDYTTKVHGYKASTWDTIGSQVQQDMNSLHQAYNEWIDGMSLTYW